MRIYQWVGILSIIDRIWIATGNSTESGRRYIALILARGGSKQIPKKNLAVIENKSLLRRTLEIASAAEVFNEIWVSTDDSSIYEEAILSGAKVFVRGEETSTDTASSFEAVSEFCNFVPNITVLALLQCTSPFQSTLFLRKAYFMMEKKDYDSVFSVTRNWKLLWKKLEDGNFSSLNFDLKCRPRRQNIQAQYSENGMFYWFHIKLIDEGLLQSGKIGVVEIPDDRSLEIDTYENLEYARYIAPKLLPRIEWEKKMCLPEERTWL